MKTCIKMLLMYIFVYLCISFIVWDLNPVNWESAGRVVYIFLTAGYTFCFLGVKAFDK